MSPAIRSHPATRYAGVLFIALIAGFVGCLLVPTATVLHLLPACLASLAVWLSFSLVLRHYEHLFAAWSLGLLWPLLAGALLGPTALFSCLVSYPRLSVVGLASGSLVFLCVRPRRAAPSSEALAMDLAIAREKSTEEALRLLATDDERIATTPCSPFRRSQS